jgi:glutathione synthase/RimK-type ligase-like ATP-grasp enzyme
MLIGLATCAALPGGWPDDHALARALGDRGVQASFEVWDDAAVDWDRFDLVLIRSTWDYTDKRDAFLGWAERLGARLRNPPSLVRWNSDKRYLAELEAAGLRVVPTRFVEPGREMPALDGELVIKPVVSAGARDTGRFGHEARPAAEALLRRIGAQGRAAMVQPYLAAVDSEGETAIVFFGGSESHVLRKRAVLRPDEEAPIRRKGIAAAEVMFDEDLVGGGEATEEERATAAEILDWVAERFEAPLYARVDLVPGTDGRPVLLELEAVEPNFYLHASQGAAARLAEAVLDDLRALG